jgi:hypothetical protein
MTEEQAIKEGILENKIVYLKPIPQPSGMIRDPKHIGYFMFDGAFKSYPLPRDRRTGSYKKILNSKEMEAFSEMLQEDLSFTKQKDNFWDKFSVRIEKSESLMTTGKPFDLSKPWENLEYRVLKANREVAEDYKKRDMSPVYIWYFAEAEDENIYKSKEAEKTQKIWMFFGTIQGSRSKMSDLISVYYAQKNKSNVVDPNATKEWMQGELHKIIENDPDFILETIEDDNYDIKALIINGVKAGAIIKKGRNKYNIKGDGVDYDYLSLVNYISILKRNTEDEYLSIKEQVDAYLEGNKTTNDKE